MLNKQKLLTTIVLNAFVGWYSIFKNMHGMSNIKFANAQQAKEWQYTYNVTLQHIHMMFIPFQLSQQPDTILLKHSDFIGI